MVSQERKDIFGNRVVYFSIEEPHLTLEVNASSELRISPLSPPNLEATPAWEEVQALLRRDTHRGVMEARQFVLESPFVNVDPLLSAYARPAFAPGRPLLFAVHELMRRIFIEFVYDPEFTTIATPLLQVFEHRRGVCQDFAHFAIACLRSLGLSARYVADILDFRFCQCTIGAAVSTCFRCIVLSFLDDFDPTKTPAGGSALSAWDGLQRRDAVERHIIGAAP
jgi:transglutaminase-like putative cysteine protease